MKIELNLYQPYEKEAFATFLNTLAAEELKHWAEKRDLTAVGSLGDNLLGSAALGMHDDAVKRAAVQESQEPATSAVVPNETGAPEAKKPASRTKKAAAPKATPEPDTAETEAQDAADEAADSEQGETLTHDSVRGAMGEYVKKYGMPATMEDGPKVLADLFGKNVTKVSEIPDDQESLAKAVGGFNQAIIGNPYKRAAV